MGISFLNVGCRLNYAELDYLASYFQEKGNGGREDFILINTCAVTQEAERKSLSLIRRYGKNRPVIVTGCLVGIAREKIENLPGVYRVLDLAEKEKLIENILPLPSRRRALVKVVDGCPGLCTFCVVPEIRGREIRSKPEEVIFSEISFLVARGFSEIVLTGLNLGLYGKERNSSLTSLLWRIFENCPGDFRVRLSSLEPDTIDLPLIKACASLPVCRHLHLAIQSFHRETLRRMGRRYQPEEVKDKIALIISEIPEVNLGCDIIVGFSGEGEEAFLETKKALEEIPFGYFHIFPFSPRPKTPAFSLPDDVPKGEKKKRVRVLWELGRRKRKSYEERFFGRELWAVEEREGMAVTDNYIRVKVLNPPVPKGIFPIRIVGRDGRWVKGIRRSYV
ncbi:MAG: radical SAM protein [candidate division WOR-3 bacterium]